MAARCARKAPPGAQPPPAVAVRAAAAGGDVGSSFSSSANDRQRVAHRTPAALADMTRARQ
jgi:hypothetical protein